jgi:hypothetical protein
MHELHLMLTRAWKTLFAYQFVIRTRPGVEPEASVGPSVRFGRFEIGSWQDSRRVVR